jgi:large subunit ribosomal protein L20
MVNLSLTLLAGRHVRNTQLDKYWRKRQVLRLSASFYGRRRNCFSIAIRAVQRTLQYVTQGRRVWKAAFHDMWEQRITSGCQELGYIPEGTPTLLESLSQSQVLLNRQSLATLAIWEPRTFKAINKLAAAKAHEVGFKKLGPAPQGVITRGML